MAHLRGLHRGAQRGTEGLAPWYELVREIGVEGLKYVLSEVLSRVLEYSRTRPGSSKQLRGRHNVFKISTGLSTRTLENGSTGRNC